MEKFKYIIVTTAFLLWIGSYSISEYFYPGIDDESLKNWWRVRLNIISLVQLLIFFVLFLQSKNYLKVLALSLVIFSGCDFADRLIFNITNFNPNDKIIVIPLVLLIFIKKTYYVYKSLRRN